jgi:hypothetical protein
MDLETVEVFFHSLATTRDAHRRDLGADYGREQESEENEAGGARGGVHDRNRVGWRWKFYRGSRTVGERF